MTTFLSFVFVLGVLVFVHELGHFLVAKKAGMRVQQFSLGFPPKAFGITVGETEYCVSWLPLGGYVKIAGMSDLGSEKVEGKPWEFQAKPIWMRMAVLASGPGMNFLLGFLIILGVRLGAGEYAFLNSTRVGRVDPASPLGEAGVLPGDRVLAVAGEAVEDWEGLTAALTRSRGSTISIDVLREQASRSLRTFLHPEAGGLGVEPFIPSDVGSVLPGHPAQDAGLLPGDRIVAIDGISVTQWWEMSREISAKPEKEIEIRWVRDRTTMTVRIVPRATQVGGETVGRIGIGMPMTRTPVGFGKAFQRSGVEVVRFTATILVFVKRLVSGQESGRALAGPVAIAQMAGQSARQGWEALFSFMALLSVNLAVLNLLPIPILDGGHLLILSVEGAIRRPLSGRQKEILQQLGFAFLLFLMIYVTFGDLGRIFGWFN